MSSPSCLGENLAFNFYDSLLFSVLLPLSLALIVGLVYTCRAGCCAPKDTNAWKAVCLRNAAFVVFLFYPGTAQRFFYMVQPCVEICSYEGQEGCTTYLPSDYSIPCSEDTNHSTYVILTWAFGVTLFVVAIPLALLWYLWRQRDTVHKVQRAIAKDTLCDLRDDPTLTPMLRGASGFFEPYNADGVAYLWGVIDLARKVIFTSVILVATPADSYTQIIIGVCVAFFFIWVTEHVRPFADREDHILQQMADFTIGLNMVIGMGLRALENEVSERTAKETEADRQGVGITLIVFNAIILVVAVWQIVALRFESINLFTKLGQLKARIVCAMAGRAKDTQVLVRSKASSETGGKAGHPSIYLPIPAYGMTELAEAPETDSAARDGYLTLSHQQTTETSMDKGRPHGP